MNRLLSSSANLVTTSGFSRFGRNFLKAGSANNFIAKRSIFIDTEATPNPQSMKFIPGQEVLPEEYGTGMFYQKGEKKEILKSPLAKSLFDISGIKNVFFGREFITITKENEESWNPLKPQVFSAILDFYAEGKSIIENIPVTSDTAVLSTDSEIVATIKELIETRVRPSVQEDGGDIFYEGFDEKTGMFTYRLSCCC
jgi:NFU1 iron-sulfur cluster scaffold homolog, mitochondrial